MFRNRLYYRLKPLLPTSFVMAVRRWFAVRGRQRALDSWPILPRSDHPPHNWPGWPDGKQFGLVLTHDVEGPMGLEKCRRLAELELKLGFRSSFNFIPEGDYTVPAELRADLVNHGFEVGVHDLHHDGTLYRSRRDFAKNARRINQYLQDWDAVGFRSGSMFHQLDWLHDLEVSYDASTFDTDPFEPQPDGMNTIFPFWVPRRGASEKDSRQGYVELPYTLPQDSTLFLLFGERHPDIWFQKLDWVARHGGMALVIIHPDYLQFDDGPSAPRTFPAEFYERFLKYARERYGNAFWHALPRETAAFVAEHRPTLQPKPRRVCMVTYSDYRADARVTRYAEALAERGDQVDVLALRRSPDLPRQEQVSGVNLVRLQSRFGKTEKSRVSYLVPVLRFLAASTVWIARRHLRQPYDLLHIHNVPDFLVFAAWYPRLTGAKVILDIHDIVPEFYASKFGVLNGRDPAAIKLLKWLERRSASVAHRIIIANHLWLQKYATRTGANGKCTVFINNVDTRVFHPRTRARHDDRLIVLFPGGLQWHQGLDIAIRAFHKISSRLPQAEFHIYGDGNMKERLVELSRELGLNGKVRFFEPLPVRQIAGIMAEADLGVVPKRADSFGNEAYSTKIMEFMSLQVPVVVSSTRIDRFYFDDSVVRFFESGNDDALAEAMFQVLSDSELRGRLVKNAAHYAHYQSWEHRKDDYLALVDKLIFES